MTTTMMGVLTCLFACLKAFQCGELLSSKLAFPSLVKPTVCGKGYFENLQQQLTFGLLHASQDDALMSNYCRKFSAENEVSLNIYDSQGTNLCVYRNPYSMILYEMFTKLNQLSFNDRINVYNSTFYLWLHVYLSNVFLTRHNIDISGIEILLSYARSGSHNSEPDDNQAIKDRTDEIIVIIDSHQSIGKQYVPAISYQQTLTFLFAPIPQESFNSVANEVRVLFGIDPVINDDGSSYNEIILLFDLINSLDLIVPTETIIQELAQIQALMIFFDAAGVYNSFAMPTVVNGMEDGICKWAFTFQNLVGKAYRIVLSQSQSILMFK